MQTTRQDSCGALLVWAFATVRAAFWTPLAQPANRRMVVPLYRAQEQFREGAATERVSDYLETFLCSSCCDHMQEGVRQPSLGRYCSQEAEPIWDAVVRNHFSPNTGFQGTRMSGGHGQAAISSLVGVSV